MEIPSLPLAPRTLNTTLSRNKKETEERDYKIGLRTGVDEQRTEIKDTIFASPRPQNCKEDSPIDIFGNKRQSVQPKPLELLQIPEEPKKQKKAKKQDIFSTLIKEDVKKFNMETEMKKKIKKEE
jgi:hypothetical protein